MEQKNKFIFARGANGSYQLMDIRQYRSLHGSVRIAKPAANSNLIINKKTETELASLQNVIKGKGCKKCKKRIS